MQTDQTASKITLVFPMAGEGQRFGSKFKPFLKIFNKTFIQMAIDPLVKHKDQIANMVFIVREDHFAQFDVERRFQEFGLPIPYEIVPIKPTSSPTETIRSWMGAAESTDRVIFCDCDHSVDASNLFAAIADDPDVAVMGYPIRLDEIRSWSVASSRNGLVKSIAEKQYPADADDGDVVRGVIGCYYFKHFRLPKDGCRHLSDVIAHKLSMGQVVRIVDCLKADFFGDPSRLDNLYRQKNASTVFCDIDGTIVRHENIPDYTKKLELLDGARERIQEWRKKDHSFIVLTTSRDEQFRPDMETMLREAGIEYELLVMGLPPGPRYLVNDRKPYSDKTMASAHEVVRNQGIKNLRLGNSIANLRCRNDFLVKSIPNDASEYQQTKFKAQYDSISAIGKTAYADYVPWVSDFTGHQYAMENLIGYCGLHLVGNHERMATLRKMFDVLTGLYQISSAHGQWLDAYLQDKIYSKERALKDLGLAAECENIFSFLRSMTEERKIRLQPKKQTSFFVGDLTYENILTNGTSFKLIDFDNDNKAGIVEMDLGKLLQSHLAKYEWWDGEDEPTYSPDEYDLIVRFYADLLNEPLEVIVEKGHFYCALHLFRMIPYQAARSPARAKKAIDLCARLLEQDFPNSNPYPTCVAINS